MFFACDHHACRTDIDVVLERQGIVAVIYKLIAAVAYNNVGSYLFTGKYRIGYGYLNIVYRSCGDFEGL